MEKITIAMLIEWRNKSFKFILLFLLILAYNSVQASVNVVGQVLILDRNGKIISKEIWAEKPEIYFELLSYDEINSSQSEIYIEPNVYKWASTIDGINLKSIVQNKSEDAIYVALDFENTFLIQGAKFINSELGNNLIRLRTRLNAASAQYAHCNNNYSSYNDVGKNSKLAEKIISCLNIANKYGSTYSRQQAEADIFERVKDWENCVAAYTRAIELTENEKLIKQASYRKISCMYNLLEANELDEVSDRNSLSWDDLLRESIAFIGKTRAGADRIRANVSNSAFATFFKIANVFRGDFKGISDAIGNDPDLFGNWTSFFKAYANKEWPGEYKDKPYCGFYVISKQLSNKYTHEAKNNCLSSGFME
ncbi:MAG: hypothetical protein JSS37_08855 [Proteobacteria bacterium]|nr:hypothetical protein [Pseudomonadota bacterium]